MHLHRLTRIALCLPLAFGFAKAANAHTAYADLTGLVNGLTVTNFTNYGWANGTRVAGVGTATTNLGNSHYLQIGAAVSGSNYVAIFKFMASKATATITATDTTASATDYADPAISLYRGFDPANPLLSNGSHDAVAVDPLVPILIANPPETGSTWPFDGLRVAGSTNYDGQFSAFGDFSMGSDAAGSRRGLVWLASSSARSFADGNPAHNKSGNGVWGKLETLNASGLVPGQVYTVIVGGERCIAKSKGPYAALGGGTCNSGAWNINGRYSINVKVN